MTDDRGFDAFVMVDWSASSSPGRRGGQANGIWVAVGEPGQDDVVVPFPTRAEATAWLIEVCAQLADAGRRVLLGVDVAFGYPAGTARALGAPSTEPAWRWTWDHLALEVADGADNDNNRFEAADTLIVRMHGEDGPFWGHPPNQAHPHLSPTKGRYPLRVRGGVDLAEYRHTERWHRDRGRHPKSVWQLSGAGAVGSQTLLGIPRLRQVRLAPPLLDRCVIWPQETGFTDPLAVQAGQVEGGQVVVVEVYPSLAPAQEDLHEIRDAAQVLTLVAAYRRMAEDGSLSALFGPPDLPPDVLEVVAAEEGWILDVPAGVVEASAQAETILLSAPPRPSPTTPDAPTTASIPAPTHTGAPSTAAAPSATPPARSAPFDWTAEAEDDLRPTGAEQVRRGRLRDGADAPEEGEAFDEIAAAHDTRIVEILSSATPDHAATTQEEDEWVVVLEGRAELDVDGTTHVLQAGDWLWLPAGTPHQVTSTAAGTRWLAVHIG